MSTIDLNNPPPGHNYSVSVGREETAGERRVRLCKDVALFALAIVFVGIMTWICVATIKSETASPDEKKWAMSILSAAAGGVTGYLLKK